MTSCVHQMYLALYSILPCLYAAVLGVVAVLDLIGIDAIPVAAAVAAAAVVVVVLAVEPPGSVADLAWLNPIHWIQ